MTNLSILIAGGAGFIGSHLVEYFLEKGACVTAIDNLSTGRKDNIVPYLDNPNFTFIEDNIVTCASLPQVIEEVDYVFNFAATAGMFQVINHPMTTLTNNTLILSRVLKVMAESFNQPVLVHASSSEVYGSNDKPMKETDSLILFSTFKNHATYPISKLYNETEAFTYYQQGLVPIIILRLFNIVGTRQRRQYGMVLPRFLYQALHNEPISIFGDGLQTRSFCHVDYLCQQIESLINHPQAIGEVVNVGNSQKISIIELARLVKKITGSEAEFIYHPLTEVYGDNYLAIRDRQPDLTKIEKFTSFKCCWSTASVLESVIRSL